MVRNHCLKAQSAAGRSTHINGHHGVEMITETSTELTASVSESIRMSTTVS
jgi:hypothetical protein